MDRRVVVEVQELVGGHRGGRGRQGGVQTGDLKTLPDDTVVYEFYQTVACYTQLGKSCTRNNTTFKHVCTYQRLLG